MSQQFHIPLESVRVARPCRADWSAMEGDDRVRFCQTCHKNVYNLSSLDKEAAQALVAQTEGKLCVRFYQRTDGSVLTSDCPVGAASAKRPFAWLGLGAIFLAASGFAAFRPPSATPPVSQPFGQMPQAPLVDKMRDWPVVGSVVERISPRPIVMMGAIAPMPMPPVQSPGPGG